MNINNSCALIFWEHSLFFLFIVIILFKLLVLIILFVVEPVVMVFVVALFMLISVTHPARQPGILAQPYHLNQSFYCDYFYQSSNDHYIYRGGHSGASFSCGIFCVRLNSAFSGSSWNSGAALSFKLRQLLL